MPPEAPRRFQFTLRKALLALAILSPCMLAVSAFVREPSNLVIAFVLLSATLFLAAFLVAMLVLINRAVGGQVVPREPVYVARRELIVVRTSSATIPRRPLNTGLVFILCYGSAIILQLLELSFLGSGHGWGAPVSTSSANYLFAFVYSVLVVVGRRRLRGRHEIGRFFRFMFYLLALACVVTLLAKDIGIIVLTREQGWKHAAHAAIEMLPLTVIWLAMLGLAHYLGGRALLSGRRSADTAPPATE